MEGQEWWVLRCRGLPYSITKAEIESFFDTSVLATNTEESVQITYNEEGRPSGECFVVVMNEESYYNALRKNNEYLKSRYIEVFESDYDDMSRALQKGAVNRQCYGGTEAPIVKLRGLPFSVTEEQVKEFFSGLKVASLKIRRKEDGEATGEGYVKFSRQDEATAALEKHMQKIGHRYIEVFKGSKREMKEEMPLDSRKTKKIGPPPYMGGPQDHKVFMRGIPFKASQGDVIKFFAPLMPRHIEIIMGDDGRPSGTAYAFFHSHEDAILAMEKDKEHMDTRYVDLFLESSPEPVPVQDSMTHAQQLIAQAHGLAPPSSQPEIEAPSALTAQQLIAQAHGMTGSGYQSVGDGVQGYGQTTDPYAGVQPPPPSYPAPPAPASAAPVRKRLMAGAVRPVNPYKSAENDPPNKRFKSDQHRGRGRGQRGRGFTTRGGRGASARGTRGFPPRGRGGPPLGGFPPRVVGSGRKPVNLMVSATDTDAANGGAEDQQSGDAFSQQNNMFSGYPGFSTANSQQYPNFAFQNQMSASHDPNSNYQSSMYAQQDPNTGYSDPYSSSSSVTDPYAGYDQSYTGYAGQNYGAGMLASDYANYYSAATNGAKFSYQS